MEKDQRGVTKYMRSLTKAFEVVQNAGDRDAGLENGAVLKSYLELLELIHVLFYFAINVRHETILKGSFPLWCDWQ